MNIELNQTMHNQSSQRREETRNRTRLRSGKIADLAGNYLVDCQVFDRSPKGARLRLMEACELPDHIRLFDDELDLLLIAVVVWINVHNIGVEFPSGPENVETQGKEHAALGGRYYAIKTGFQNRHQKNA